jgi:hypothetical protein
LGFKEPNFLKEREGEIRENGAAKGRSGGKKEGIDWKQKYLKKVQL